MAVSNLNSQYHKLYLIWKNDKQLNIQTNITNLDRNDYKIEITFKSEQQETEEISNLTFYENENDFLTFSNIPSNINLNVFSSNKNQLKTHTYTHSQIKKNLRKQSQNENNQNINKSLKRLITARDPIIYPVNLDFTENSHFTFNVKSYLIQILDANNKTLIEYVFKDKFDIGFQISSENTVSEENIIFIMTDMPRLNEIYVEDFTFIFEGNGYLSIQFPGWEEKTEINKPIMFNFYANDQTNLTFIPSRNKNIKYKYFKGIENPDLIDEYPTTFIFCLPEKACNIENFDDLYPIKIPIPIPENIASISSDIEEQYLDAIKKTSIKNLIFLFDHQFNGDEIDLNLHFLKDEKLSNIMFISSISAVNLKVSNLPNAPNENKWTVKNCKITVENDQYIINELISYYSLIKGPIITHGTYFENIDLDNEYKISISEKTIEFNGYKYNINDNLTIEIKTNENKAGSLVFEIDEKCSNISLNVIGKNEEFTDIPISFGKVLSSIDIQLNVSSNEHISFLSIPEKANFIVYSIALNSYVQQIYADSLYLYICYESDICNNEQDLWGNRSITVISTKKNYDNLMNSLKETQKKRYEYLRLIFVANKEGFVLKINNIPDIFNLNQIQLYGYDNPLISLEKNPNTGIFKQWLINQVTFTGDLNAKFEFDDLIIINTSQVFHNAKLYSDNIIIKKVTFHCRNGYSIPEFNYVYNVEQTFYEIFTDLDINSYTLSISGSTYNGNDDFFMKTFTNDFTFIFHKQQTQNFIFYINRFDTFEKEVSIKFENAYENLFIQYDCFSGECNKNFKYNFEIDEKTHIQTDQGNCTMVETIINGIYAHSTPMPTHTPKPSKTPIFSQSSFFTNSECFSYSSFFSLTSVFTLSSPFSISASLPPSDYPPTMKFTNSLVFSQSSRFSQSSIFADSLHFTPSFPFQDELPKLNHFVKKKYGCSYFHMKSNGFRDEEYNDIDLGKEQSQFIDIGFTSKEIFIEESNKYSLSKILYFVAENSDSTININENLKNSIIGIKTDNSPKIILNDFDSSINLMNYEHGYTIIDIECHKEHDKDIDLQMRDVNNSNGYLILSVAQNIQSISFTSLFMARISSFEIRQNTLRRRMNGILLNEEDEEKEDKARIIVKDNINISSESNVILTNVQLKGKLNIYDDSILTFKKETIFDPKSMINISIKNSKDPHQQPIIRFDDLLNTTPDKFTITFDKKVKSSDLKNYVVLEGTNFKTCLTWIDKLEFINKGKTEIESKCEYSEGGITRFIISVKKKKLSLGAIIGIVLGCIAIAAIIIIIIILIIKQHKPNTKVKYNESEMELDDSTF